MTEMRGVNQNVPAWLIRAGKISAPFLVALIVLLGVIPHHTTAHEVISLLTLVAVVAELTALAVGMVQGSRRKSRNH